MSVLVASVVLAAAVAVLIYLRQERLGFEGLGLAALRTLGLGALLVLLWDPGCARPLPDVPPVVLLDRSLSMGVAGAQWAVAADTARKLAGDDGILLGFGARVGAIDDDRPLDGTSRVREALTIGRALGRPAILVTDGELDDGGSLTPGLLADVRWVVLPRHAVSGAALTAVDVSPRVTRGDSVPLALTVALWGELPGDSFTVECLEGARRLVRRTMGIPRTPATLHRVVALPPGTLGPGTRVLTVRITAADDPEPRDNERQRLVTVSDQPAVVVIVDPADWEGRFLVQVLERVSGSPLRGFARIGRDVWVDMRSATPATDAQVRRLARQAGLLVLRGNDAVVRDLGRRGPVWRWPSVDSDADPLLEGDWYVDGSLPSSPLAAGMAPVEWDSLPPLDAVRSIEPTPGEWVALTARRGRRGSPVPVLLGGESGSGRTLTTLGTGLWRWTFRGGAGLEATRALLAAGLDWLLQSPQPAGRAVEPVPGPVVTRGTPLTFRWRAGSPPDSLVLQVATDTSDARHTLALDATGRAILELEPGVYRWAVQGTGAEGTVVVEGYSDEFPPRLVADLGSEAGSEREPVEDVFPRSRWWLFFVAVIAFGAEWAWRQRRGLP